VPIPDEPTALVTGASAAVGRALLEAIAARGRPALALSRREPPAWAGSLPQSAWRRGSLDDAGSGWLPPRAILLSAGPLAALVDWLEREGPDPDRLVALSSTSLHVKRDSVDPVERATITALADAERRVAAWCEARSVPWTILRPTLIVSARDGDALDWIARAGRRFGVVALPRACHGRRQPIAAADVAAAMLAAIDAPNAMDRAFDLPGSETLPYLELVRRVIAARAPGARLLIVPTAPYRFLATMARRHPALAALTPAVIGRMSADLVFDGTPAGKALGLRFGDFDPTC
jgi:uncharacterized protein YbjT (DUF2867 family)